MTEHIDIEKIKDRIAKLLAMAADASSPNEAAIAAGRARSLMDKYQVSEFDVSKEVTEAFMTGPATKSYMPDVSRFVEGLAVRIAQFNDCQARFEGGFYNAGVSGKPRVGRRIVFMGYQSDVELAQAMYSRLTNTIKKLGQDWCKAKYGKLVAQLLRTFEEGATNIVAERLKAMTEERDTITHVGSGTALMIIKKDAVSKHFGNVKYGTAKPFEVKGNEGWDALQAGRVRGAAIEIVPGVEGNRPVNSAVRLSNNPTS
jgi:hypothetical protein